MIFLGYKLRELREVMEWSMADVEKMTGIRQSGISDLENGKTKNPRPDTVQKLAEGLRIDSDYFYLEDAKLPKELMPDMPVEIEKFIMSGENIPYIVVSEKAKREGIPPAILQQALDLLIANRDIKK